MGRSKKKKIQQQQQIKWEFKFMKTYFWIFEKLFVFFSLIFPRNVQWFQPIEKMKRIEFCSFGFYSLLIYN